MDHKRIKSIREAAGLTQATAAAKLGWHVMRWSDVERGKYRNPRIETLLAMCKALGCEVTDVLKK